MKTSLSEKAYPLSHRKGKWRENTNLRESEPDCWALADSNDGIYLITARTRDSEDQLCNILIYIFEGRDIINTPIAAFKINCYMRINMMRLVVAKLADLLASNTLTPWELRDRVLEYDEIVRVKPKEPIFGTNKIQKSHGYKIIDNLE